MAERIFPNAIRMAELVREGKSHQNENDCVSNAAELVEQMRLCADDKNVYCKGCKFVDIENNLCMNVMVNCAADAIEQLVQENAKLKAERDALLERIVGLCSQCKYQHTDMSAEPCFSCDGSSNWEWRGVKEEEA